MRLTNIILKKNYLSASCEFFSNKANLTQKCFDSLLIIKDSFIIYQ